MSHIIWPILTWILHASSASWIEILFSISFTNEVSASDSIEDNWWTVTPFLSSQSMFLYCSSKKITCSKGVPSAIAAFRTFAKLSLGHAFQVILVKYLGPRATAWESKRFDVDLKSSAFHHKLIRKQWPERQPCSVHMSALLVDRQDLCRLLKDASDSINLFANNLHSTLIFHFSFWRFFFSSLFGQSSKRKVLFVNID